MKNLKKVIALVLCLVTVFSVMSISASAASVNVGTAKTGTSATYTIKNSGSGKILNVYGSKSASNTNVTIYQSDGTKGQKCKFISNGTMTYNKVSFNKYIIEFACASSCALNVYGSSATNNANVNIWKKSGNTTQAWIFEYVTSPTKGYIIRSANNPKYVLTANGTSNSSNVCLKTYSTSNKNQVWTCSAFAYANRTISTTTTYMVTYNANGGSVSTSSAKVTSGSYTILPTATKASTKITYNANGGTGAPSATSVTYTCLGWSTNSSDTTASYSCRSKYTPTKNITLYAVWKTAKLSTTIPKNGSKTFLGWSTSKNATTATYIAGQDISKTNLSGNVTLYAVWARVGFCSNGVNYLYWPVAKSSHKIGGLGSNSDFGPRNTGIPGASTNHMGIDLAVGNGTQVYSVANGIVTDIGENNVRGKYVVIYHEDLNISSLYQHLSNNSYVKKGASVSAGTLIAKTGDTGIGGYHLHFGLMTGKATNPNHDQHGYAFDPLGSKVSYIYCK